MLSRFTTVIALTALVAAPLAMTATSASATSLPITATVKDATESGTGHDITRMTLHSAIKDHDLASVNLQLAKTPKVGDGVAVWFNLDKDKQPDAVLVAYAKSEWFVSKADTWTGAGDDLSDKGCFHYFGDKNTIEIAFDPACLGESTRMQVSAMGFRTSGAKTLGKDYTPAKFTWSRNIQSFRPYPGV